MTVLPKMMSAQASVLDESQKAPPDRFNIMVIGESWMGKTTCVQTLLNALGVDESDYIQDSENN